MKHLYIQTAFLGDLLLAVPTFKQIRIWDSQAEITLICRKGLGSLFLDLGLCEKVVEVNKENKSTIASEFKGKKFDTLFCPHQSFTSHKIVKQISASKKIGYHKLWNASFFDYRIKRKRNWPEAIRQLQLLAPVFEDVAKKIKKFEQQSHLIPDWAQMQIDLPSQHKGRLQEIIKKAGQPLKDNKKYICVAPGSVWPTKRWSSVHFVKVCKELANQDFQVVLLGAPDEATLCEDIKNQCSAKVISFAGELSILESLIVLSEAQGFIGNDSGAMHMASLFHKPTLALFGPTVQELGYKPWNPMAQVIERPDLLCRPCGQHGAKKCPIGTHACMTGINPQLVTEKARAIFT